MKNKHDFKKIVFRCDASSNIGWGHLTRCLAVAEELKKNNEVIFASIKDPANFHIKAKRFKIFFKKTKEKEESFLNRIVVVLKPDILVIDKKFPYPARVFKKIKQKKIRIIMIDNICEGMQESNVILFPAAHLDKNFLKKYLSPKEINRVKAGPEYVIIRKEISALRKRKRKNFHAPSNIVVTTGGTDPKGVLLKLIPQLRRMNLRINIFILTGKAFKFSKKLANIKQESPPNFHFIPYSPKELLKGDIAICVFGVSIYELIYLQIPTICVSHSIENAHGAEILEKRYGVIKNMGYIGDITSKGLCKRVKQILTDKRYFMVMAKKCDNLVDGRGVKRIANIILREDNS